MAHPTLWLAVQLVATAANIPIIPNNEYDELLLDI
jgi:regulator of PEP synthase PpsR (kinase-PPPase family)